MSANTNRSLIRRYHDDLWNAWDLSLIEQIIAPDITYRGSLGTRVRGREQFRDYAEGVQRSLPDFHIEIDDIIAEKDRVAVRVVLSGTQRGTLLGVGRTDQRVEYQALGIFQISRAQITDGYVLADTLELVRQMGVNLPMP